MISNRHPLRYLPILVVAGIVFLSKILSFNGLYGQDAHQYLHLSQAYAGLFDGGSYFPAGRGDAEFAVGYPLAAALLSLSGLGSLTALQIVTWLSAGLAAFFFDRCLQVLSPGARPESRWVFIGLGLLLAPCFLRAGLTVMSDALGLALVLAALSKGLKILETGRIQMAVWSVFFAGLAVITRFSLAALLAPFTAVLVFYLWQNRKWALAVLSVMAGGLAVLPHFWVKANVLQGVFEHSLLQEWSPLNYFQASFSDMNGTVHYSLPNILYLLFPLMHPGFCLPLPGLLLLAKRTDIHLLSKKVLAACGGIYLLFLGGIPHQNLRYLLPAYAILLLLLFPAWDRMFAYGLYFFKRLTYAVICLTLVIQIAGATWMLAPVLARNRLETAIAGELRNTLPPGALLFAFDLDVALRNYLPDIRITNLWEKRYTDYPRGSFILFNEPLLRPQWQGRNPILNWDDANTRYRLREIRTLQGNWKLYEVKGAIK